MEARISLPHEGCEPAMELAETFEHFQRLADRLGMPEAERLAVLNLQKGVWWAVSNGCITFPQIARPSTIRRLNYAIWLMRRQIANLSLAA